MDIEIIFKNATLTEAKELFAAIPARIPIKVTQTDSTGSQPQKVPVETVHAKVVETEKHYHSRWQIPFSCRDDKKKYQNAWHLCKKHNLPYPEAMIKEAADNHQPSPLATTHHYPHPTPTEMAAIFPAPVTMDTIPKSENIEGWKVRQIKADRGKRATGILTVATRKNGSGLIECQYEGKRQIIDATCLEVVERV